MSKCELCHYPDGTHSINCRQDRKNKLQLIKDMGVEWTMHCPSNFGLINSCETINSETTCSSCWVYALEEPL